MAHRIEVGIAAAEHDAPGERVRRRIHAELGVDVARVRQVEVYTVEGELSEGELERVASGALSDPVLQVWSVDRPLLGHVVDEHFDWAVEVALRPGVTDNVGRTAREAIALLLDRPESELAAYHGQQLVLTGALDGDDLDRIASGLLANELIQRYRVLSRDELLAAGGFAVEVPKVEGVGRPPVEAVSLDLSDDELAELSRQRVLALTLPELHAIRDHFRRADQLEARRAEGLGPEPTDVELEAVAQTWSEHCKHKIFNACILYSEDDGPVERIDSLFDTYIRGATQLIRRQLGSDDPCLSVFSDNAGVIRFDDDWSLVMKVETHNSPSALDPYGGALTGIVGVNRDPFGTGMGARLVFNTDVFCLADPFRTEPAPAGLLHPRRVLEGVRLGVEHGGNTSGIPTVNGSVVFDERFLGKPLVFCGTGGLLPRTLHGRPGHEKQARPGDRVVMVGGRIGADGIHGATFSSEELHEGSPSTAVQIGDPITQKRMTDFLLRARDEGLYTAITDNGAGGLSSSVGEMAEQPGGCDLDLTRAPLKYEGLAAWEILLSEAQERMTVAVPPERLERFLELAGRFQVEATDLGEFTDSGVLRVRDHGQTVARLDLEFLHHGLPPLVLEAHWSSPEPAVASLSAMGVAEPDDHGKLLRSVLGRLNVCSKAYWVRQYDHEVQAGSVVKPLTGADNDGPSDAAVLRPRLDSMRAVAVSHGLAPRYSDLDAYHMAQCSVDEAVRNAVAVGADPDRLAALDNFCWCDPVVSDANPDGRHKLAQLVRANRGLYDACVAYGLPLISGKDSMKNDAVINGERISIPPTLLVSLVGIVEDARRAVTMDVKRAGDLVLVLGVTRPELGGSEYLLECGLTAGVVPEVRPDDNRALYRRLHRAIRQGLVASCHDCSDGGLAAALAESALAGGLGLEVDLRQLLSEGVSRDDEVLYAESAGRLVVTVAPEHASAFAMAMEAAPFAKIGTVTSEPVLRIAGLGGETIVNEQIAELKAAWQRPLAL
jgi:phosphoribosylformylglycinamidine synthase